MLRWSPPGAVGFDAEIGAAPHDDLRREFVRGFEPCIELGVVRETRLAGDLGPVESERDAGANLGSGTEGVIVPAVEAIELGPEEHVLNVVHGLSEKVVSAEREQRES